MGCCSLLSLFLPLFFFYFSYETFSILVGRGQERERKSTEMDFQKPLNIHNFWFFKFFWKIFFASKFAIVWKFIAFNNFRASEGGLLLLFHIQRPFSFSALSYNRLASLFPYILFFLWLSEKGKLSVCSPPINCLFVCFFCNFSFSSETFTCEIITMLIKEVFFVQNVKYWL